tara:strand:+ start:292 stop:543 length:252 start_codon:yes stop_codon:yes gene_type:complete
LRRSVSEGLRAVVAHERQHLRPHLIGVTPAHEQQDVTVGPVLCVEERDVVATRASCGFLQSFRVTLEALLILDDDEHRNVRTR